MADRSTTYAFIGQDKFSPVAAKVKGSAGGMVGAVGKVKVGAAAAAAGVALAGKALWDMGVAAAEDAKSQAVLARQLENSAGATKGQVAATEEWISAQGVALGVTDDQLRPALGRLVRSTGDVDKAQQLAALAMDVSAGTGKDLSTVAEALARAEDGQTTSLKRLGIETKNADGSTKSFKQITQDLAKTFQGQASTAANTAAGKWARLRLRFDELKESIGAKLLPIAEKFADWLIDKALPAVEKFGKDVMPEMKKALADAKIAFEAVKPGLILIGKLLGEVAKIVFTKVLPALARLAAINLRGLTTAFGYLVEWGRKVTVAILTMSAKGIGALADLTMGAVRTFGAILSAASKGLGWLPGIGSKIRTAEREFRAFGDRTVANLRRVQGNLEETARDADNLGRKKPRVTAYADTKNASANLDTLRRRANTLDGKRIRITFEVAVRTTATGAAIMAGRVRGFAAGSPARGRTLAWVGERGPELVRLPSGSSVMTATQSRTAAARADSSPTVVQVILDRRVLVEALVHAQRDHGGSLPIRVQAVA